MKVRKLLIGLTFSLFLFTQWSCEVINPEEDIPAYLNIASFTLADNAGIEEFSLGSKIVAANVLVNERSVGVIPIPGTIPVFADGEATISLDPLVQLNGAGDALQIYPFWERVILSETLTVNDTLIINPQTKYLSEATVFGSDFSGNDILFAQDLDENLQTFVSVTGEGAQPGEGTAGRIVLTSENSRFDGATAEAELIDVSNATRAYLEVQYKTDTNLIFGILDKTDNTGTIFREYGVLPKDSWNTIYFDMNALLLTQGIGRFQLTLSASYPTGSGLDEAIILLDNIKVVYL